MKLTEDEKRKISKKNMKLYPTYIMFAYDLLFFYGIKVMFFSEVKGIESSQILLSSSLYAIFYVLMQFPSSIIVSKLGKKNTIVLGNIINILSIILYMAFKTFNGLVLAEIISAISFSLKNLSESNLLTISIPESKTSNDIFTNIDKKGMSKFYVFSAISTILSGWLYKINPYLPIIFCLISAFIGTMISFNFGDLESEKSDDISLKEYIKELKKGYKFTMKSKRLRALLLAVGVIYGIISVIETYQLVLLQDIGISSVEVTLIYALYEISKAIFSLKSTEFNKKFKNRSITNILGVFSFCLIFCGILALLSIPMGIKIALIIVLILTMGAMNGISQILSKKYLNSFTNEKILTCIYSARGVTNNILRTIITSMGSLILSITEIDVASVVVGLILIVVTFFISMYMEGKVGLSPDEYTQKDIYIK